MNEMRLENDVFWVQINPVKPYLILNWFVFKSKMSYNDVKY